MILEYGFHEVLAEADNIFDLVGICFGLLCDNVQNQQAFTSTYFDQGEGDKFNPNIDVLNKFSEDVMETLKGYTPSKYTIFIQKVFELVSKIELQSYMKKKENQLTIIYCILSAIDSAAGIWERYWMSNTLGPLDRQYKTKYRVYFNLTKTIHREFIDGIGRNRVVASDFFEQFENFRFINADRWKDSIDVPQIKYLHLNKVWKQKNCVINKLKVAVIPVSVNKNFKDKRVGNNRFVIEYSGYDQEALAARICLAVKTAIDLGSNMIVLPEYVVSQEIFSSIQQQVKNCHKKMSSSMDLMLVFAGSAWMEEQNNVMKILDSWGEVVGEYYKYTPYTKPDKEKHGLKLCELLNTPGKCCDLIAIEEIGLFLPAICRDMIDGDYTAELAKFLLPAFIIISAWSPSLEQFKEWQRSFANKYFISSVLANACSARSKRKIKIGNGGIVSKKGTISGICMKDIKREKCMKTCDTEGCLYILEYDFSYIDKIKNTDIEVTRYKI